MKTDNGGGKQRNSNSRTRSSNRPQNKQVYVGLSKFNKMMVNASVAVNAVTGTILYYNLPAEFGGSDAAQALWLAPVVLGIYVLIAMYNTSSENNQD